MLAAATPDPAAAKPELYAGLLAQAKALLEGERDAIANAANLAALLFHTLPDLNWAGFYWMKDGGLVLGPFQGKPACVRIALGKGVCGTAAASRAHRGRRRRARLSRATSPATAPPRAKWSCP